MWRYGDRGKAIGGMESEGTGMESGPTPWFFVSVAAKELSWNVSLLDATLAGSLVNVAGKGLTGCCKLQLSKCLNVARRGTRLR